MAGIAIPLGVSLLGSVLNMFGASKSSKAAKEAAAIQAAEAARAGKGIVDTTAATNRDIISGADRASQMVGDASAAAGKTAFAQADRANALLDPYRMAGEDANAVLTKGIAPGGQFNAQPTAADIQMDPGIRARLKLGLDQLDRSAAARGGAASGTALMGLEDYRQTTASNEYEKAFQRFQQNRQNNFANVNAIAGRGRDVAGTEGSNLITAGKYSGDKLFDASLYSGDKVFGAATTTAAASDRAAVENADLITQAANSQAAGKVASANAWNEGLRGVGSSVATGAGLYSLLKNPARPVFGPPVVYPQPVHP